MNTFEKLLEKWNGDNFRGAKKRFANAVGVADTTVSAWCNGRLQPAEDKIKRMPSIFAKQKIKISEEELYEIFGIEAKQASLKKIEKVIIDIPTLGIIKDKEVIFVPSTSIPKKEDVAMKKEFDLEVTDNKLPPYKKKEMVHFLAVDSIKGYEGRRFIVKDSNGVCSVMQLNKPNSKYEVLAVVLGRYIPEE